QNLDDRAGTVRSGRHGLETASGLELCQPGQKRFEIPRGRFPFAQQAVDGSVEIGRRALELSRNAGDQAEISAGRGLGAVAAKEFNAPILPNPAAAAKKYDADLAGTANVRPSAGLKIDAGDFDGAKRAGALDLFAHAHVGKLFRCAVANRDFAVLEHD